MHCSGCSVDEVRRRKAEVGATDFARSLQVPSGRDLAVKLPAVVPRHG